MGKICGDSPGGNSTEGEQPVLYREVFSYLWNGMSTHKLSPNFLEQAL